MGNRRNYKRKGGMGKKVNTVFKLARNNRFLLMGETKHQEVAAVGIDAAVVEDVTLLTSIDVADFSGATSRIGDEVTAKSLTINLTARWQANALEATLRIIVVQKTKQDPVLPTIAAGVQNSDILRVLAPQVLQVPLWVGRKGWKILMDERFIGDPNRLENITFKRFFKLKHKIYYGASDGSSAPLKGNIWLILFSDEATAADAPQVDFATRITFKDI